MEASHLSLAKSIFYYVKSLLVVRSLGAEVAASELVFFCTVPCY